MSHERYRLSRSGRLYTPTEMKMVRWFSGLLIAGMAGIVLRAQVAEPSLPRPGAVLVLDVIGEAKAVTSDQQKPVKVEERLRVGSTIVTERMSLVTLILSNGATLRIGSESELEVEEFGQATISGSPKFVEMKAEPTVSRTRLRLVRGDVTIEVKPLNVSRGSSFMLATLAGTVRSAEGKFHAGVRMSDLGLGVCTIEVENGSAEFEPIGGNFIPVLAGRTLAFALELDRVTGAVKVSDMPTKPAADTRKEAASEAR
jgi:hypothetical protein